MIYKAHMRRYYIDEVEYTMEQIMDKFNVGKERVYKMFKFDEPTSRWNGHTIRYECYRMQRVWIVDGVKHKVVNDAAAALNMTIMTLLYKSVKSRPQKFEHEGHTVKIERYYERISRDQMPEYNRKNAQPLKDQEKVFDYVTMKDGTRVVRQYYKGSELLVKSYSWSEGEKYLKV